MRSRKNATLEILWLAFRLALLKLTQNLRRDDFTEGEFPFKVLCSHKFTNSSNSSFTLDITDFSGIYNAASLQVIQLSLTKTSAATCKLFQYGPRGLTLEFSPDTLFMI